MICNRNKEASNSQRNFDEEEDDGNDDGPVISQSARNRTKTSASGRLNVSNLSNSQRNFDEEEDDGNDDGPIISQSARNSRSLAVLNKNDNVENVIPMERAGKKSFEKHLSKRAKMATENDDDKNRVDGIRKLSGRVYLGSRSLKKL